MFVVYQEKSQFKHTQRFKANDAYNEESNTKSTDITEDIYNAKCYSKYKIFAKVTKQTIYNVLLLLWIMWKGAKIFPSHQNPMELLRHKL